MSMATYRRHWRQLKEATPAHQAWQRLSKKATQQTPNGAASWRTASGPARPDLMRPDLTRQTLPCHCSPPCGMQAGPSAHTPKQGRQP